MARFASNKRAFGYSERSGFKYKLKDMRKEWNGLTVGYDEYESKHPQIRRKHIKADAVALANARPRPPENEKEFLLFIKTYFSIFINFFKIII